MAFFGGGFDPVHPGHLKIARAARDQAALDQVIFLPAAQSPLKQTGPKASGEQRREMLLAALAEYPWADVSDWELQRPGPSYSWQTVEHFQSHAKAAMTWFWLMGADQWVQLERWKRWEFLAEHLTFLVFAREGQVPAARHGVRMIPLQGVFGDSSTAIREARRTGAEWETLVSPPVARIIHRDGLYLP